MNLYNPYMYPIGYGHYYSPSSSDWQPWTGGGFNRGINTPNALLNLRDLERQSLLSMSNSGNAGGCSGNNSGFLFGDRDCLDSKKKNRKQKF
uniref:Uncharacterized protein n=1 Tax=Meloidogyne javanica TaxID=6303 RepID=A0A915LQ30_MELJA